MLSAWPSTSQDSHRRRHMLHKRLALALGFVSALALATAAIVPRHVFAAVRRGVVHLWAAHDIRLQLDAFTRELASRGSTLSARTTLRLPPRIPTRSAR